MKDLSDHKSYLVKRSVGLWECYFVCCPWASQVAVGRQVGACTVHHYSRTGFRSRCLAGPLECLSFLRHSKCESNCTVLTCSMHSRPWRYIRLQAIAARWVLPFNGNLWHIYPAISEWFDHQRIQKANQISYYFQVSLEQPNSYSKATPVIEAIFREEPSNMNKKTASNLGLVF